MSHTQLKQNATEPPNENSGENLAIIEELQVESKDNFHSQVLDIDEVGHQASQQEQPAEIQSNPANGGNTDADVEMGNEEEEGQG